MKTAGRSSCLLACPQSKFPTDAEQSGAISMKSVAERLHSRLATDFPEKGALLER